jgi:hypothetical protein
VASGRCFPTAEIEGPHGCKEVADLQLQTVDSVLQKVAIVHKDTNLLTSLCLGNVEGPVLMVTSKKSH